MNYLIVTILFLLFFAGDMPAFLIDPSANLLTKALLYSFFHANVFHLLVNSIVAFCIFRTKKSMLPKQIAELLIAYGISVLVYIAMEQTVVGFSIIIYAIIGLRSHPTLQWWKRPQVYFFLAVSFGMLLIPQFAGASHLMAFFMSVTISTVSKLFKCKSGLKQA